jgi:hypothetical protein
MNCHVPPTLRPLPAEERNLYHADSINIQCGFPGNPTLRNVLLTQARYDEFSFFRDGLFIVDSLPATKNRMDAFGLSAPVAWDTTYGTFADGTARSTISCRLCHVSHHDAVRRTV